MGLDSSARKQNVIVLVHARAGMGSCSCNGSELAGYTHIESARLIS